MRILYFLFLSTIVFAGCENNETKEEEPSYESEDIIFKSENLDLEGTFYKPNNITGFPTVVIVNGSGPSDRDGSSSVSSSPPIYKNWAATFALNGIGVFRYDKRFLTHTDINPLALTQENQISDIISSIKYLKSRPDIDTNKLFIVGHSEGGNLAPFVAKRLNGITGIVLAAAPSFAVDSLVLEQLRANPNNPSNLITQVETAFEMIRNNNFPTGGQIFGAGEDYWREWINLSENVCDVTVEIRIPVFIVQGEKDENFPSSTLQKNINLWENTAAKTELIEQKIYKNVTHMLLNSGSSNMAEDTIDEIINWIKINS